MTKVFALCATGPVVLLLAAAHFCVTGMTRKPIPSDALIVVVKL